MVSTATAVIADSAFVSPLTLEERQEKERLGALACQGMIIEVPVDRVQPFKGQPREFFDQKALQETAGSIEEFGQIKPIDVKWLPDDPVYYCQIIDGERRWRATHIVGRATIRVLVVPVRNEEEQFVHAFISNFGNEGHTALEKTKAILRMMEMGWNAPRIAKAIGKSTTVIYQHASLVKLSLEVQALLEPTLPEEQQLNPSVAFALVNLPAELQLRLAKVVIAGRMKTVQALQYVRRRASEEGLKAGDARRTPRKDFANLQSSLRLIGGRLELMEGAKLDEIDAMFAHRDPQDHAAIIRELEELGQRISKLGKLFSSREVVVSVRSVLPGQRRVLAPRARAADDAKQVALDWIQEVKDPDVIFAWVSPTPSFNGKDCGLKAHTWKEGPSTDTYVVLTCKCGSTGDISGPGARLKWKRLQAAILVRDKVA